MNVITHGSHEGVTGSCHEIRIRHTGLDPVSRNINFLIDCGLFQGADAAPYDESPDKLREFPFDPASIHSVIITHAHLDHFGRLPYLIMAGFKGDIYCSRPTAKLLPVMLEDAVRQGITGNKKLIKATVKGIQERIIPVEYNTWTSLPVTLNSIQGLSKNKEIPDQARNDVVKFRLQPAGHILGSAYVEVELINLNSSRTHVRDLLDSKEIPPGACAERSRSSRNDEKQRIVFSGDLGAPWTPLLAAPKSPYRADLLILESTYGDRLHEGRRERKKTLSRILKRTLKNKGTTLIPAFSLGRTQEFLYELGQLAEKEGYLKDLDIVLDSPMAKKITDVYRNCADYLDVEARRSLTHTSSRTHVRDLPENINGLENKEISPSGRRNDKLFYFPEVYCVESHEEHLNTVKYLKKSKRPSVVISASGMCAGGRIINYLKALIDQPETDVLFIGYQAEGTPGNAIQQYGPRGGWVELDGKKYDIKAGIYTISGYSAHADQKDLVNFVKRMPIKPKEIRLVHGDERAKTSFKQKLLIECPGSNVMGVANEESQ